MNCSKKINIRRIINTILVAIIAAAFAVIVSAFTDDTSVSDGIPTMNNKGFLWGELNADKSTDNAYMQVETEVKMERGTLDKIPYCMLEVGMIATYQRETHYTQPSVENQYSEVQSSDYYTTNIKFNTPTCQISVPDDPYGFQYWVRFEADVRFYTDVSRTGDTSHAILQDTLPLIIY